MAARQGRIGSGALLILAGILGAWGMPAHALPAGSEPLEDGAGLLSRPASERIASRLAAAAPNRPPLRVITVPSLEDERPSVLARRFVPAPDRGTPDHAPDLTRQPLVLLIAWRERAVWLGAPHLESDDRQISFRRIVVQTIVPAFRRNAFDQGVEAAISALLDPAPADSTVAPTRPVLAASLSEPLPEPLIFRLLSQAMLPGWLGGALDRGRDRAPSDAARAAPTLE